MALIFDCETDGLLADVTKIHCLVIKDTENGISDTYSSCAGLPLAVGLKRLAEAPLIVGHNIIKYDLPVIAKLYPNWVRTGAVRDTLTCTRLIWADIKDLDFKNVFPDLPKNMIGRHSLKAWGYRLGELKGEYGETTDWQTFTPEMLEYCKQDVEVTAKLWAKILSKNYSEQAIELEHQFAEILFKQEQHGILFDKDAAITLYSSLGQRRAELERELAAMIPGWDIEMKQASCWAGAAGSFETKAAAKEAGLSAKDIKGLTKGSPKVKHIPFNPSSRDHIARALTERHGWKPKAFTPDGKPQVDESVLEELPYPEAKLLNECFLIEKRIGMLAEGNNAWLKLEKKGRIHGDVTTNGAVTGRCTHSRPNMAQVPSCNAVYGRECRSLFNVPPGFALVGADASGLELRCLAHYMARYDNGAYAKELLTGDIHTTNQKAAGLPTRDNAKTFIYALLYGAGDEKIGRIVGRGASEGKILKSKFFKATPALARLKQDVTAAAQRGYLVGLDGRQLSIRSEHAALNTLLQSAGALIVKQATVFLYQDLIQSGYLFGKDWALVAHVHDEMQIEAKETIAEDIGKRAVRAMERAGDHFQFRCPITGEYHIGKNWAETH